MPREKRRFRMQTPYLRRGTPRSENADDVDAYMTAKKGEAGQKSVPEGASFNTDDFFEAALRRSYGDGAEAPDIPSGKGKK